MLQGDLQLRLARLLSRPQDHKGDESNGDQEANRTGNQPGLPRNKVQHGVLLRTKLRFGAHTARLPVVLFVSLLSIIRVVAKKFVEDENSSLHRPALRRFTGPRINAGLSEGAAS